MPVLVRKSLLNCLLLILVIPAHTQEVASRRIADGIWHRSYRFADVPWSVQVVEVDLHTPSVFIRTIKAMQRLHGLQRTSSMALALARENQWVAAGINGDFYQRSGMPVNTQVAVGKILQVPARHAIFGIYEDKTPFIESPAFQGRLIDADGAAVPIDQINHRRNKDQLVLYNDFFGDSTGTNRYGTEVSFALVDGWAVNDTFRVIAIAIDSTRGNRTILHQGGVLSGHGAADAWLRRHVSHGDTLALVLAITRHKRRIAEAIGGLPQIIDQGRTHIAERRENFTDVRHPRSGIGISRDKSTLYLFGVDGRQPGFSAGMTLTEMADFMIGLGAYQALNLDGGGSTTIVVANQVVNQPSDAAGERPVSNALLIISTEPLQP